MTLFLPKPQIALCPKEKCPTFRSPFKVKIVWTSPSMVSVNLLQNSCYSFRKGTVLCCCSFVFLDVDDLFSIYWIRSFICCLWLNVNPWLVLVWWIVCYLWSENIPLWKRERNCKKYWIVEEFEWLNWCHGVIDCDEINTSLRSLGC